MSLVSNIFHHMCCLLMNPAILTQAQAIVNIYLHENAMILDNMSEENKTADIDISNPAAAARISALSSTLASIHQAIDTICSIPPRDLINVPTVALARTAFAIVALIKLYSIVTAPDSYIGQVIEPQDLKVEIYLDKVIAHYTAAGSLAGGVTPGKFSTVMSMLREWFKSRKDQHGDLKRALQVPPGNAPASETDRNRVIPSTPLVVLFAVSNELSQSTTSQGNTPQGNTPLHLLSVVASEEKTQSPGQQQQYQQTYARSRPDYPLPQSTPETMAQAPALPPCISPSQLPSQLPANTTTAPDSWGPYDSQRQFYPAQTPFDPTTTTSPGQQPAVSGYPDFSVSGSNTLMMPPSASMGMFAPELGVGLDEQFWSSMGQITGDMMFFPPQGSWSF